jgi:hypothetical protein
MGHSIRTVRKLYSIFSNSFADVLPTSLDIIRQVTRCHLAFRSFRLYNEGQVKEQEARHGYGRMPGGHQTSKEDGMNKVGMIKIGLVLAALWLVGFQGPILSAEAGGLAAPEQAITIDGKKPARFDHAVHIALSMACGQCHHNGEHQPRNAEEIAALPDASGLRCISCHNGTFANPDLQKAKDVFHGRCRECHKTGFNGKKGPSGCNDCHIKA